MKTRFSQRDGAPGAPDEEVAMVRIGVIGCGKISQVRHIPEYEANPNAQLVGLFDVTV